MDDDLRPRQASWIMTFADMMTLLMVFFILILSFSSMEVEKFKLAMGSLKGAFGIMGVQKQLRHAQSWFSPSTLSTQSMKQASMLDHVAKLRSVLQKHDLNEQVDIILNEGDVFIQIKDHVLFESGHAELRPTYVKLLPTISHLFFSEAKKIIIEGHTDNTPINTPKYPSNWELSVDRAFSVLHYYVNVEKIDPAKMGVAGFGEHKPLVANDSPLNKAKNRRVVIRMKM